MAFNAVNLADAAGDTIPAPKLAEINATAALQPAARYFLRRARKICIKFGADTPAGLKLLTQEEGHRFFVDQSWSVSGGKDSFLSSCGNEADPLCHVQQAFREHLLERALYSLVTPGYNNNEVVGYDRGKDGYVPCFRVLHHGFVDLHVKQRSHFFRASSTARALQHAQLLMECSNSTSDTNGSAFAVGCTAPGARAVDEVSRWWGAMVSVAAYWLTGDDNLAEQLYGIADVFPKQLQAIEYVVRFLADFATHMC